MKSEIRIFQELHSNHPISVPQHHSQLFLFDTGESAGQLGPEQGLLHLPDLAYGFPWTAEN